MAEDEMVGKDEELEAETEGERKGGERRGREKRAREQETDRGSGTDRQANTIYSSN